MDIWAEREHRSNMFKYYAGLAKGLIEIRWICTILQNKNSDA